MTDPANPGQQYGGYNNPYNQQGGTQYPPQGGNPYGAPAGSGYPPQGNNPYGPPGGAGPNPYPPQGGGAPVPPYGGMPTATPPRRSRGILSRIVGAVVVLVVLGAVGLAYSYFTHKNDTTNAKVNDCIHSDPMTSNTAKEVKNAKIVKCSDASANYKVIGIVQDKTEIQFDADNSICAQFADAEFALWQGVSGQTGSVLCLAPTKKK